MYAFVATGDRWKFPLSNVFFSRLLDNPQAVSFLEENGVPGFSELLPLRGETHLYGTLSFTSSQLGSRFFEWLSTEGKGIYFRYLLSTAFSTIRAPWQEVYEHEAFEQIGFMSYDTPGFEPLMSDSWAKFFSLNLPAVFILLILLFSFIRSGKTKEVWQWFPMMLLVSAYLFGIMIYLIDSYDINRHLLTVILPQKISGWLLVIFLIQELSSHQSFRSIETQNLDPLDR